MSTSLAFKIAGSEDVEAKAGTGRLIAIAAIALVAGVVAPRVIDSGIVMSLLAQGVIYALLALGVALLVKQNGMVSFGHAMYFGLPGYFIAIGGQHWGLSFEWLALLSVLSVGVFGLLLGAVIVRVPGIAFSMLTLAVGQGFFVMISRTRGVTGGADGLNIDLPDYVFGVSLDVFQQPGSMFTICWVVMVVLVLLLSLLLRTRFGALTEAIRENEERVRFLGFRTLLPRAVIYSLSAMVSCVAGVLSSLYAGFISPESLHWSVSGAALIMVVLGGTHSLWGAVAGAIVYLVFRDYLGELTNQWMMIFGASLIAVIVLWPKGIAGGAERAYEWIVKVGGGRKE